MKTKGETSQLSGDHKNGLAESC